MEIRKFKKTFTKKEAFLKACAFCAYQERLQEEVRNKLHTFRLRPDEIEEIISMLIEQNFLNEERFAKAYAGGKFRIKKWGKIKITRALELKKVSAYSINQGLKEIPEEDYHKTLEEILSKKKVNLDETNEYISKQKVAQYAIGKGFEPDLVWQFVNDLK